LKALGRKLAGEQLDRTSALREPSPPATPNTSRVVAFREEASCQVEPGPRDQPRQWRAPIDARRQVSAALPFKRELPHARDRCGERNEVKWGFACCGIRGQCSPLPENPGGENTLARQSPKARVYKRAAADIDTVCLADMVHHPVGFRHRRGGVRDGPSD